jgi:hypothetical protein
MYRNIKRLAATITMVFGLMWLFWASTSHVDGPERAREAALVENLFCLRESIKQYRIDKGREPAMLEGLVTAGYLRRIPADPIIETADSWIIYYKPTASGVAPQIANVRSGAKGKGPRGIPYFDH